MPTVSLSSKSPTLYLGINEVANNGKLPFIFSYFSLDGSLLGSTTNAGKFTATASGTATPTFETTGLPMPTTLNNQTYSSGLLKSNYPLTLRNSGSVLKVMTTAITSGVTLTGKTFNWSNIDYLNFLFKITSATPVYTIVLRDDTGTPKTATYTAISATNYGLEVDKYKRLVIAKSSGTIQSGFNWSAVKEIDIISDVATTFTLAEIQSSSDNTNFIGVKNDILISCINEIEINNEIDIEDAKCFLNNLHVSPTGITDEFTFTLAYFSPALDAVANSTKLKIGDFYGQIDLNDEYNLTFVANAGYAEVVLPTNSLDLDALTISINGPALWRADSLSSVSDSNYFVYVSGATTIVRTASSHVGAKLNLFYKDKSSRPGYTIGGVKGLVSGEMMCSYVDSTGKVKTDRFPKVIITGYKEQREEGITTYECTGRMLVKDENGQLIRKEVSFS